MKTECNIRGLDRVDSLSQLEICRGTTSRRKLPCGCVQMVYSSPDIPFGRSAIEKKCKLHKSQESHYGG